MSELARSYAFTDERGNRFLFPGFIIMPYDYDKSIGEIESQAMVANLVLQIKLDYIEFDPFKFPNFSILATSRGFRHGGEEVYLFAGPEFERMKSEL